MVNISEVVIGVDVSKHSLDIFIKPIGLAFKIANSKQEILQFIEQLKEHQVKQIACEATGGYEKPLIKLLKKHSYAYRVIDPRRVKGFIIAKGGKAKTDKIDAQRIAEFAASDFQEYVTISKTLNEEKLQALVDRKADLVHYLAAEKTRLKHPSHELSASSIKKFMTTLEKEIKQIEKQVSKHVKDDESINKKVALLESIPGIGKATAALLVSHMPELGLVTNSQISALLGVCPYNRESGNYKGKSFMRGGRMVPRNTLYTCALTTIKYHLPLKAFYDRLIANKKPFKVAIVAVMRKLIVLANTILKKGEPCKA